MFAKVLTKFQTVSTVNVEGLVALVYQLDRRIEHETIRAYFFRGHTLIALVVLVALDGILELTSTLGAFELCIWGESNEKPYHKQIGKMS